MALSHTVDSQASIIRFASVGPTNPGDLYVMVDQLLRDARLEPGMGILGDWTGVEGIASLHVAFECVRALSHLSDRLGPLRVANLVPDDAHLGISHAAATFARNLAGIEIRSFLDMQEAEAWLRRGRRQRAS